MQTPSKLGRFLTLLLCGVLLLFLSMEAVHAHHGGAPDLQHCPLCFLAHAVPQAAAGLVAVVLFTALGRVAAKQARAGHMPVLREVRIRPPPFSMDRSQVRSQNV